MAIVFRNVRSNLEGDRYLFRQALKELEKDVTASKILIEGKSIVEYGPSDVDMLRDILRAIELINLELSNVKFTCSCNGANKKYSTYISQMYEDPIAFYVKIKRLKISVASSKCKCKDEYLSVLNKILNAFENTKMIRSAIPYLIGYNVKDRSIYSVLLKPTERPAFSLTKFRPTFPYDGNLIEEYKLSDGSHVRIFSIESDVKHYYHIVPRELTLTDEEFDVVLNAIRAVSTKTPIDVIERQNIRENIKELARDEVIDLMKSKDMRATGKIVEELSEVVMRSTVGFGPIEALFQDKNIQDIHVNPGETPIFIYHDRYEEMSTNVIPTVEESESWATKLKLESGSPFDEASPIMDTYLNMGATNIRISATANPLSMEGLSFSFRKHREMPWTYPSFIRNRMFNDMAAGLLSVLASEGRSVLFAGTRGSGKTSLLGATLFEILPKYRIITIEDTPELPVKTLESLNYNVVPFKVSPALSIGSGELSAEKGVRASLRMGDSCLIVGEVRSREAIALYEAMRVGALANFVGGTIHAESPYGVFDRVVNDLGISPTSFKATDIIVTVSLIKSPSGLKRMRRVTRITEVKKHWSHDPMAEGGFVDLMVYDPERDELVPTDALLKGQSDVVGSILNNIKGRPDVNYFLDLIKLKGSIAKFLADMSSQIPRVKEAAFVVKSNIKLAKLIDAYTNEYGKMDINMILDDWKSWFANEVK